MTKQMSTQLATYEAGMIQAAAFRNLTAFMHKALLPSNITMSEWSLLGALAVNANMRPSDIATLMDVKTPMATRLVKSLVEKDLIHEKPVSGDQRGKMIAMTPKGQELLESEEIIIRDAMRAYMVDVPLDDLNAYLRVLAYLARHQP